MSFRGNIKLSVLGDLVQIGLDFSRPSLATIGVIKQNKQIATDTDS